MFPTDMSGNLQIIYTNEKLRVTLAAMFQLLSIGV